MSSTALPCKTETAPRSKNPQSTTTKRGLHYFKEQLAPDVLLETELMFLALAAGINDATTFSDYGVFASNQTGNTALLAVGALGLAKESVDLRDIGLSLGLFMFGGFVLGQLGYRFGRTTRAWLLFSNVLQTSCVLAAAALRKWTPTSIHDTPRYAVISLLALASGGQVAMARTVNVPEVTTAMVTSAYIDFLVDPSLLVRNNRPRNRRAVFVVALLSGSFIGAAAYREIGPAFGLLLAGLVKLGVCFLLFVNRQRTAKQDDERTYQATSRIAEQQQNRTIEG